MQSIEPIDPKKAFLAEFKGMFAKYEKVGWTEKQKEKLAEETSRGKTRSFMFTSIPMICKNTKCIFASQCPLQLDNIAPEDEACHPPGTLIMTRDGLIPIERLSEYQGRLWGWERRHAAVRSRDGFAFKVQQRHYHGTMIELHANQFSHEVTENHISAVRFNKNALNKFAVYLMRKGDFWRIGKTKLFSECKPNEYNHKTVFGPNTRTSVEKADALWILGIYENNTEASLMEEFWSLTYQTTKTSFATCLNRTKTKWNGLHKWATEEQLWNHHRSLQRSETFYREMLHENALSIDFPLWKREKDPYLEGTFGIGRSMYIRACNIIPEIMDIPCLTEEKEYRITPTRQYNITKWIQLEKVVKSSYAGDVYSLDVEGNKTYFANGIATHNCPYEYSMVVNFMADYIDELNIDPENLTELSQVRDLVDQEVQYIRKNRILAQEDFIQEFVVGIDSAGEPIMSTRLHLAIDWEDRILKRKAVLWKQLLASREAQAKVGIAALDSTQSMSNLMTTMRDIQDRNERALKQRLGLVDEDDYIEIEAVEDDE